MKPLKEVCQYQRGLTYTKSDEVEYSSNIVLRANNIDLGTHSLNLSDLKYISDDVTVSQTKRVLPGSLLICTASGSKSHLGKVAFIDQDYGYAFGGFMGQITPKKEIEDRFLFYVLTSSIYKKYIDELSDGVNINNLKYDQLGQFPVIVPPLPEQRRIVAILDEAFEGIATAKANAVKNLQNAREVFESNLNAVFSQRGEGWVDKPLKDVAIEFGRGKSKHRPRNDLKLYGGSFPFIQTGDVRNSSHLITSYDQTYNDVGLAQSKLWPKGTLCITIAANIAETGILDFDACFPDSIIGLVANEKVTTSKYIEYLLTSFKSRLQVLGKGSAQDNINLATFEHQYFPFPPINDQKEIISIFDALHEESKNLESLYQQKLTALDELKQSLLHQAFNGDL